MARLDSGQTLEDTGSMGVTLAMKTDIPVDKKHSISMLRALGAMLANGARSDAKESRERARRQLERVAERVDVGWAERHEPVDR